jgi:hypothetical protein
MKVFARYPFLVSALNFGDKLTNRYQCRNTNRSFVCEGLFVQLRVVLFENRRLLQLRDMKVSACAAERPV